MAEYQPKYRWSHSWPDDRDENGEAPKIFQGYDGKVPVGSIQAMKAGPKRGQWMWSGHGPRVRERLLPQQGYEPTGREACRMAEEYYDRLIEHNEGLK